MAIYKNRDYIICKDKIYIHYGSDHYDPSKMDIRKSVHYPPSKPKTGLWGSPVESDDWRYWCEGEEWNLKSLEKSFKFTLSPEARILVIKNPEDIDPYIKKYVLLNNFIENGLDLEKIYSEYDAMEVYFLDNYIELHNDPIFYSWDMDSLCIWNPDVIIPVK